MVPNSDPGFAVLSPSLGKQQQKYKCSKISKMSKEVFVDLRGGLRKGKIVSLQHKVHGNLACIKNYTGPKTDLCRTPTEGLSHAHVMTTRLNPDEN